MAFNDTLFQLGMDLTRSSTAQKEEFFDPNANEVARASGDETTPEIQLTAQGESQEDRQEDRKDFFIERDGKRFAGTHLIIDLFGARRLDDLRHVEATLRKCVEKAGATLLHIHLHHFTPNGGVSGVAVLAESHISIHSWPEADYAALDVFMCGESQPHLAIDVLREAFDVEDVVVKQHLRGEELEQLKWKKAAFKKAPVRPAKVPQKEAA